MQAIIQSNMIIIQQLYVIDGDTVCVVDCEDYEIYKKLPQAIEVENKLCEKTGWDSDKQYACYKSNVKLGRFVDKYV